MRSSSSLCMFSLLCSFLSRPVQWQISHFLSSSVTYFWTCCSSYHHSSSLSWTSQLATHLLCFLSLSLKLKFVFLCLFSFLNKLPCFCSCGVARVFRVSGFLHRLELQPLAWFMWLTGLASMGEWDASNHVVYPACLTDFFEPTDVFRKPHICSVYSYVSWKLVWSWGCLSLFVLDCSLTVFHAGKKFFSGPNVS